MVRCVGWLVDRPSKRQRAQDKLPDWVGSGSGSSLGAESRLVSPDAAKSSLRYPVGNLLAGGWASSKRQAAVGDDRAGRSSRPR